MAYRLSGAGRSDTPISGLNQTGAQTWTSQFPLPADAGRLKVETLKFVFEARDDLDNLGTAVPSGPVIQVYQGDLPPYDAPTGLTATALPGGKVTLTWEPVAAASDYQLYRQSPTETELLATDRTAAATTWVDDPGVDGLYRYAVASVRQDNNQEALSGLSNIVEVTADSVAPNPPQTLALELTPAGIQATWQAPNGNEPVTYSLYRSSQTEITAVDGLTPVQTQIETLTALDTHPSETDHAYVVTAVDAVGNKSAPSNSVYLNFDLLPVATLTVVQEDAAAPVIRWTHRGTTVAGYDLYLGAEGRQTRLNTGLITGTDYTDTGFDGNPRRYYGDRGRQQRRAEPAAVPHPAGAERHPCRQPRPTTRRHERGGLQRHEWFQ